MHIRNKSRDVSQNYTISWMTLITFVRQQRHKREEQKLLFYYCLEKWLAHLRQSQRTNTDGEFVSIIIWKKWLAHLHQSPEVLGSNLRSGLPGWSLCVLLVPSCILQIFPHFQNIHGHGGFKIVQRCKFASLCK